MSKKQKSGTAYLGGYWFHLRPLNTACLLQPTSFNFAPQRPRFPSFTPLFFPHRLEMAPCFVPPAMALTRDELLHYSHQLYFRRSIAEDKSYILEPKPRQEDFCMVCRLEYDDYRTHILREEHKRAIRNAPFHRHILKLIRKVQKDKEDQRAEPSPSGCMKGKPISKGKLG